jgi:hypothetical protein
MIDLCFANNDAKVTWVPACTSVFTVALFHDKMSHREVMVREISFAEGFS